jgi:uncharacterized membrane protein YbjE (DUF340 family)
MKNSLIIVTFFICGIFAGLFSLLPEFILENDLSSVALYILMFFVGIGIGADKNAWNIVKNARFKIILVPVSVIVGTFIGVGVVSMFLSDITLKESLAVGSGFGYYSLSSILITQMGGKILGVTALLSNIFREIITLLFTPLFAKYFGKLAPIVSGGATSMDSTLPVITKYVGKEYAVISVFNGTVLTILVPFLVTLIMK